MRRRDPLVALAIAGLALGCKQKSEPVPVDPPPTTKPADNELAFRQRASLHGKLEDGRYRLADGAGKLTLVLPGEPTLSGDMMREAGVEIFHAQAVLAGGDVDVQFGVMTERTGDMPREVLDMVANAPQELAQATGGTLAKNETATLAGHAARVFELALADRRRLFGWHVAAPEHGRMYQLNCVGNDAPASRTACEAIAQSLTLTP